MSDRRRLAACVAGGLSIMGLFSGCGNTEPDWVAEAPASTFCGPATHQFEDESAVLKTAFGDAVELPNGVLFCLTEHREAPTPDPEGEGNVTVVTMALTNEGDADFAIDGLRKNLRAVEGANNAVPFVMEGYVGEPESLPAGETAMMRFVYGLEKADWPTATGLYTFNDQWTVQFSGLEG